MNKYLLASNLLWLLLSACSSANNDINEYYYQSLNNYRIDSTSNVINEEVKVVYCSSIENPNLDKEYLIQFVAIKIKTGDTINILTDHSDQVKKDDADHVFLLNRRKISDFNIKHNADNAVIETLQKKGVDLNTMVISDPNFEKIGINNYQTIIGDISR